jgi:hypothetical protein
MVLLESLRGSDEAIIELGRDLEKKDSGSSAVWLTRTAVKREIPLSA